MIKKLERDVCDSVSLLERNCSSASLLLEGMGRSAIESHWFMCLSMSCLFRITVQGKQQGKRGVGGGGREGNWYIAERVLVGQRTFNCVHVDILLFSELKDGK